MGRARVLMFFVVALNGALQAHADVFVNGYFRADGTYVQPHMRSDPDGLLCNNWSTKGNVNPYTGEEGTRSYGGRFPRFGGGCPPVDINPPHYTPPSSLGSQTSSQSRVPSPCLAPGLVPTGGLGIRYAPLSVSTAAIDISEPAELQRLRQQATQAGIAVTSGITTLDILERMQLHRLRQQAAQAGIAVTPDMTTLDILEQMQLHRLRQQATQAGIAVTPDMTTLDILERMQLHRLRKQATQPGTAVTCEINPLDILQTLQRNGLHTYLCASP